MIRKSLHVRAGLLAIAGVFVASAFGELTYELGSHDVAVSSVQGVADFGSAALYGEPGQPELPYYTVTLLLPPTTDPAGVSVVLEDVSATDLDGVYFVKPALPPVSRDSAIEWPTGRTIVDGQDVSIYQADAFFPQSNLGAVKFGSLRQYRLLEVKIFPYRYNPLSATLQKLTGGRVVVRGVESVETATSAAAPAPQSAQGRAYSQLNRMVVNREALAGYNPAVAGVAPPPVAERYVIMTTGAIKSASTQLQNFIAAKEEKGFVVQLVTESEWGGGNGPTAAENIRGWLKAHYLSDNIAYVLLIGNPEAGASMVPMKLCFPRAWAASDRFTETDYYYAELSGNWDVDQDGLYGEDGDDYYNATDGADKYAEVAVGRIPVYNDNIADLDHILAKIIAYGNAPADKIAWRKNMLLPIDPSDASTPGFQLGEALKNDACIPGQWGYTRIYDAENRYTRQPIAGVAALNPAPEKTPCSEANVVGAWKAKPFGATIWWAHGWTNGAADVLTTRSARSLNDNYPSIVFQVSCTNAQPDISDNLAYTLLRNGAIATVAASRVSWYWIGEATFSGRTSTSNSGMAYQFGRNIVREEMAVGDALNTVKSGAEPMGMWMNWLDFNVLGDPSVGIATASTTRREVVFAVNCAGGYYTSKDGVQYQADNSYVGGYSNSTLEPISGTDDDELYQTERWRPSTYRIPGLANGTYEIKFQFAETYWAAANSRVFDVVVENQKLVDKLDVFGRVGKNAALDIVKQVKVSDGELNISFANASVDQPKICAFVVSRLGGGNVAPTASAGDDQSVIVRSLVTVSGAGSMDADKGPQPLRYSWSWVETPVANVPALSNQLGQSPTFTPMVAGRYVLALKVSDGVAISRDTVVISAVSNNQAPVAVVGEAQRTTYTNVTLQLDGSASSDPDNGPQPLQYRWIIGSSNCGEITFSDPYAAKTTFVAESQGTAMLLLEVFDGEDRSSASVTITVKDSTIAVADIPLDPQNPATQSGQILKVVPSKGFPIDPAKGRKNALLSAVKRPVTQEAKPAVAVTLHPAMTAVEAKAFLARAVRQTVTAAPVVEAAPAPVENSGIQPPSAAAGADRTVSLGATVTLDGSGSTGPENSSQDLGFGWEQLSGPAVLLNDDQTATPSFTPTKAGTYVFSLTVTDVFVTSEPAVVTVTVKELPATEADDAQVSSAESL
jgi:hypothetical protein